MTRYTPASPTGHPINPPVARDGDSPAGNGWPVEGAGAIPYHPLTTMLGVAVPLIIADLAAGGGPTDADLEAARAFGPDLAARGDVLLYGGKPGEAGELANRLAHAVAVLAFCPGGVTVFGEHWEAGKGATPIYGGQHYEPGPNDAPVGMYYTPAPVLAIIEPRMGSGAFLAELAEGGAA